MTGYKSKKDMAQDKLEQWDMPSEAFNAWWDSDYDDSANPYEINTFAYWAWAGWQAAAQPAQEPVAWATREDFYRELDRRVERMRKEMEIKSVTMRCKDYDVALKIVDMYGGHVVVGQVSFPPQCTVQVSPLEFVEMVMDKEHLVGNPIVWAQWPNKEKNT